MPADEVGTPPDYETKIGPQQLPIQLEGSVVRLVKHTRPDQRAE